MGQRSEITQAASMKEKWRTRPGARVEPLRRCGPKAARKPLGVRERAAGAGRDGVYEGEEGEREEGGEEGGGPHRVAGRWDGKDCSE